MVHTFVRMFKLVLPRLDDDGQGCPHQCTNRARKGRFGRWRRRKTISETGGSGGAQVEIRVLAPHHQGLDLRMMTTRRSEGERDRAYGVDTFGT